MANSRFYGATDGSDDQPWKATEAARASTADEAAQANADAIEASTRAASPVTAITVSPATVTLDISDEETQQLTVATTPAGKGVQVTWESSDETKATVDENGLVTPVAAGESTITGTAVHDDSITDTCVVTVEA